MEGKTNELGQFGQYFETLSCVSSSCSLQSEIGMSLNFKQKRAYWFALPRRCPGNN